MKYNPQKIEKKWQSYWSKKKVFEPDLQRARKPFYNLMMFPYPSAEGLHVGNMYAFTGADIYGRYQRMKGNDVFEPIGLDGFGIHSENYALSIGVHPKILAQRTKKNFYRQLYATGNSYAWSNKLETYDPEYYRWTQWIFTQMFKKGLAYRAQSSVNWCPSCMTVLADEQVVDGECERCGTRVIKKELEQWFFKITAYAERLLKNLQKIDWSPQVKLMQENWIGRSEGHDAQFRVAGREERITVFTTRIDTLFGATYLVLAPEHPFVPVLIASTERERVNSYVAHTLQRSDLERTLAKEKTGVFTGSYAINPATKERIPIWISDYVLLSYGTGAVMGVPAHDSRDYEFAKKMHLPIRPVIHSPDAKEGEVYEGEGALVNSGPFNGLPSDVGREKIALYVGSRKKIQYKLRDWLISRQRYWGPPIPMIQCEFCGWQPVPEKDLPVLLPYVKNFRPTGTGKGPLAALQSFVQTKCPKCKGPARRETDVSDTFLDSAWYFLRYPSTRPAVRLSSPSKSRSGQAPWNKEITKKWLPVDMYIGGAEHAVLHLLYSRFLTMVFYDWGFIEFDEPFEKFRSHGLLIKDGAKMSKSRGNIVVPDEYIKKYGTDTLRTYLMFLGPFQQGGDFRDEGIIGIFRFLNRAWDLGQKLAKKKVQERKSKPHPDIVVAKHRTIKKVTEDIEALSYNTAIAALMEYLNVLNGRETVVTLQDFETLLRLLNPFTPHIAEELWCLIGNHSSLQKEMWPTYEAKYLKSSSVTYAIQINGKLRDTMQAKFGADRDTVKRLAKARSNVAKWVSGKRIKRVIIVSNKLVNFVIE